MDQAEITLNDISMAMRQMNGMGQAIQDTQAALQEARTTMGDMQVAIDSANRNLKNLEGLTEPSGANGQNVANAFLGSIDSLDHLIEEVTVLIQALNDREGTMGALIHSREMYDDARQLLVNTNYVVVKFNELIMRLRPVVEDARVFMDKIAREPGRLIGGALNPGPGIK